MVRKLKIDKSKGYPRVDNKIRTTKAPLIGFEWEAPLDLEFFSEIDEDWPSDAAEDFGHTRFVPTHNNGFSNHAECGCIEFASPVANTIAVARRMAQFLIEVTKNVPEIGDYYSCNNNGGIHVSVSDPDSRYSKKTFQYILGMLNRQSSEKFLFEFSRRGDSEGHWEYVQQAESLCWDNPGEEEDEEGVFYDQYPDMLDRAMLREQSNRIEYRIWWNEPDLLIPAIEFTHSTYIFCRNKAKKKKFSIPHIHEYKAWLFKQPGYKTLKENAPWSLINESV